MNTVKPSDTQTRQPLLQLIDLANFAGGRQLHKSTKSAHLDFKASERSDWERQWEKKTKKHPVTLTKPFLETRIQTAQGPPHLQRPHIYGLHVRRDARREKSMCLVKAQNRSLHDFRAKATCAT